MCVCDRIIGKDSSHCLARPTPIAMVSVFAKVELRPALGLAPLVPATEEVTPVVELLLVLHFSQPLVGDAADEALVCQHPRAKQVFDQTLALQLAAAPPW